MSRDAEIEFAWGDGDQRFRLGIGQLRELQEKTDAGPFELLARMTAGRWRVDDVREVLRIGLIGGGMEPLKALALVVRYYDERPKLESVAPALRVLDAALAGVKDETLPKQEAATGEENSSQMENGPSPPSMDGDRSSDIPLSKSTGLPGGSSEQPRPALS